MPFKVGILTSRDLALEVPQKELKSYNARFVWVPELERGYRGDGGGICGESGSRVHRYTRILDFEGRHRVVTGAREGSEG